MKPGVRKMIDAACVLAVLGIFAMTWSVLDPRPVPVFLAMTLGQVVGTFSLLLLIAAFLFGLTRRTPRSHPGTGAGT